MLSCHLHYKYIVSFALCCLRGKKPTNLLAIFYQVQAPSSGLCEVRLGCPEPDTAAPAVPAPGRAEPLSHGQALRGKRHSARAEQCEEQPLN